MSNLDMYSQKITDACALIREVSGGSEYFMVFDRHPESVLEFFVAAMARVEKRATVAEYAKAASRIAELEREVAAWREGLPTDMANRLRNLQRFGPEDFSLLMQAANEIDRYYGGMVAWKKTAQAKDAQITELYAEVKRQAQFEKDVARYRWLRVHGYGLPNLEEALDAAIDAAMSAPNKGESKEPKE